MCGNAYEASFANSLPGKFTILIDDGPHTLDSQKSFVELYLPKLANDGVLIIEDVQRAYRDSYQLMSLAPANKYRFEVYDFRGISGAGDDFLFVVRHNKAGRKQIALRAYVTIRCLVSYLAAPFRRIARMSLWRGK